MNLSFPTFDTEDPVWLFPLAEVLNAETEAHLLARIEAFLPHWKTHGRPVRGEVICVEHRMIAVAGHVMGGISGCGQDALRHAVENVCAALNVALAPPLTTWVCVETGMWKLYTRTELKKAARSGRIDELTSLLDGTVQTVGAFRSGILSPLGATWAKAFLLVPTLSP